MIFKLQFSAQPAGVILFNLSGYILNRFQAEQLETNVASLCSVFLMINSRYKNSPFYFLWRCWGREIKHFIDPNSTFMNGEKHMRAILLSTTRGRQQIKIHESRFFYLSLFHIYLYTINTDKHPLVCKYDAQQPLQSFHHEMRAVCHWISDSESTRRPVATISLLGTRDFCFLLFSLNTTR